MSDPCVVCHGLNVVESTVWKQVVYYRKLLFPEQVYYNYKTATDLTGECLGSNFSISKHPCPTVKIHG